MPMRIVVSDSSCLIDLRKVSLLDLLLRLPYEFLIPNTLFEEELLKFTAAQKKALVRGGLKVVDLPGKTVIRAQAIIRELPRLSVHDGFAFALAESHPGCVLLSGDDGLRSLAAKRAMEVHGVLWVLDELYGNRLTRPDAILTALRAFHDDATVRLPRRDMASYIRRYEGIK
jgi:predicted nucleic acid-binding protein